MPMNYPKHDITGVILAGGRGARMNANDKGLLTLNDETLVARAHRALEAQVGDIIISANRNLDAYRKLNVTVVADELPGYQGPLAGILAALNARTTRFLLTVPCDSPHISPLLGPCLYESLMAANAELAVAHDGQRLHPVFSLMRADVRDSLATFLASGERKIDRWYENIAVCHADCTNIRECFINLNTPEELALAQKETAGKANEKP